MIINVKNIAIATVATLLVATLSACGSNPAPATGSSSDESTSSSSSQSQALVAPAREYVKGTKTETGYTSEYWGIQYISPNDDIMIASDEQIAEVMGLGAEVLGTDPNLTEQLKSVIGQYELMAVDLKSGVTVMILSEELPLSFVTEAVYLSGMRDGVEQIKGTATIEYDNDGEYTIETIGGKSFTAMGYTMTGGGAPTNYQKQHVHIDGKRALVVSVAYPPEISGAKESAEAALTAITVLEPQPDEQSSSSAGN